MSEVRLAPREQELKDAVNEIVSGFPEVSIVVDGFGATLFRVRDKSFVRIGGEAKSGYYLCFKASPESQEFLTQQEEYWKTPYFGQYGWVSTWANEADSWEQLKPLLWEGYCLAAPKSLLKQLHKAQA